MLLNWLGYMKSQLVLEARKIKKGIVTRSAGRWNPMGFDHWLRAAELESQRSQRELKDWWPSIWKGTAVPSSVFLGPFGLTFKQIWVLDKITISCIFFWGKWNLILRQMHYVILCHFKCLQIIYLSIVCQRSLHCETSSGPEHACQLIESFQPLDARLILSFPHQN